MEVWQSDGRPVAVRAIIVESVLAVAFEWLKKRKWGLERGE
jgi:hypothetical protein